MGGAKCGNFLVLNLDDLASEVRVRPIPKGIDRDGLHIDSHLVQIRQSLIDIVYVTQVIRVRLLHVASPALAPDAVLDEFPGLGHPYMGVNVNDHHPMAANRDFPSFAGGPGLRGRLLLIQRKTQGRINTAAAYKKDSCRCA